MSFTSIMLRTAFRSSDDQILCLLPIVEAALAIVKERSLIASE